MNTPSTLDALRGRAASTELRAHVATRDPEATPAPQPHRRHRRRWAAGLAAAAAAASAFVVVSPGGPAVSPAYAVDQQADGDVVVTIHRLEDAAGLEAALAEHGIEAEVSFEPATVRRRPRGGWASCSTEYGTVETPNDIPEQLPQVGRGAGDPDKVFVFDAGGQRDSRAHQSPTGCGAARPVRAAPDRPPASVDGEGYGLTATYLVDGLDCGFGTFGFGGN